MAEASKSKLTDQLPMGSLKDSAASYGKSLFNHTLGKASDKVEGFTSKLTDYAEGATEPSGPAGKAAKEGAKAAAKGESPAKGAIGGALSGVKDKVKEAFTGGGGKGSKSQKLVNIVEWIDVGVPVTVAYNQWTQFEDWSDFMKKLESAEHDEEEGEVRFKGQVFLSHREWQSTIKEMVPDDRIVWRSTGQKGYFDGAVTFHEYGPRLTRICIVVEYYPRGFFEKTAQIWRAVGRRVQVEMKRYVRHVMTTTILDPYSVEGWRGEIRDEEIVRTHEEVVEQEEADAEEEGYDDDGYEEDAEDSEYEEEPAAEGEAPADEEVSDEEYEEEDPDAVDDSEESDEEEYEEEPEAGEVQSEQDEDAEYEEEPYTEEAEGAADDEEYEEADAEEPARR